MRMSDWSSDVCSSDLLHFEYAAGHIDQHFFGLVRRLDTYRAGLERGQKRRVVRINAELAALTGCNHHFGDAGVERFFCADDVNEIGRAPSRERVCQYV